MHKYRAVQQGKDGQFILEKDGRPTLCPKTVAVIPQQAQISGHMQMMPTQFPCNTNCPFACIEEKSRLQQDAEKPGIYEIGCESGKRIDLDEIKKHSEIMTVK